MLLAVLLKVPSLSDNIEFKSKTRLSQEFFGHMTHRFYLGDISKRTSRSSHSGSTILTKANLFTLTAGVPKYGISQTWHIRAYTHTP